MEQPKPVVPLQNVPCPVCSTAVRVRYMDDHSPEELASCERRFHAMRTERGAAK